LDIKKERTNRGMTQQQFAELLGVTRKTIVSYEAGGNIPETKIKMFTKLLSENSPLVKELSIFYDVKGERVPDKEICEYIVQNLERFKQEDIGLKKSIDIEALKVLMKARKSDGTIDIDKIGN
jgi:DNA-binding XRE family transcriptional regulator